MSHPGPGRRQPLQPPFEAYDGTEPFLFASYSHADAETVYPELLRLHALGYRIWYDEGIPPANQWPAEVAKALVRSSFFVVFISPNSVKSQNVCNEIHLAVRRGKPVLPVYIEETELPEDLQLQIGTIQAIRKHRVTDDRFRRLMERSLPATLRTAGPPPPETTPARVVPAGEIITNSIGIRLRLIPAGSFEMGSAKGDPDEQPVETIPIEKPFYLGVRVVTQEQYEAVTNDKPSRFKGPNRPVESVSWHHAQQFCRSLSAMEGVAYRLPTEAEWEYACRAGNTTEYCFGDSPGRLKEYARFAANNSLETSDVGILEANAWGLHDMHGNVWEWCQSLYEPYPYRADDGREDVAAPAYDRVVRGGLWRYGADLCRSAYRSYSTPGSRDSYVGLRVARPLP